MRNMIYPPSMRTASYTLDLHAFKKVRGGSLVKCVSGTQFFTVLKKNT